MTTAFRKITVTAAVAVLVALAAFLNGSVAHAQFGVSCNGTITVTNNSGCDLLLTIYDNTVVPTATASYHIPTTGGTIVLPPGFFAVGCVSNAGTLIPGPGVPVGCTACYACRLFGAGGGTCCVQACGNTQTCNLNINSCPMGQCIP